VLTARTRNRKRCINHTHGSHRIVAETVPRGFPEADRPGPRIAVAPQAHPRTGLIPFVVRCGVRWIVDGMNVIGTRPDGWWKDRGAAMIALVEKLDRWTPADGDHVTVVFERPLSPPISTSRVEVTHAPRAAANSADDEIVRLVRADDQSHEIRVVTSDKGLAERVRSLGASIYPADRFRELVDPRKAR
jgi:predicted RNA-binding protein with PIN domain